MSKRKKSQTDEAVDTIETEDTAADTGTDGTSDGEQSEGGPTRATKRALYKTTLRHPSELTIARDGSYADDGRADLPVNEKLIRSMLRFSDQSHDGKDLRAFQSLLPIQVTIEGTDLAPSLIVTDGRQRIKAATEINARVSSIHALWTRLNHDSVKTKNVLVKLSRGESIAAECGINEADISANDATLLSNLSWVAGEGVAPAGKESMSEEVAILYVGGTLAGSKVKGMMGKKDAGTPVVYHLKVTYKDTPTTDAETLAISATLKNIQVANPLTVEAQQIKRLMDARTDPSDPKSDRLYSDEYIADAFGCVPLTLYNKLLILHVEPEVASAVDAGLISWKKLKDAFFDGKNVKRPHALPRPDQLDMLNALLGSDAGKGKAADAVIAKVRGDEPSGKIDVGAKGGVSGESSVSANDNGDGNESGAKRGRKASEAPKFDARWFRRGASIVAGHIDSRKLSDVYSSTLHSTPRAGEVDRDILTDMDIHVELVKEAAAFTGAQAVLLFLAGDATALDEFPNLRAVMGAALTSADESPTQAKGTLTLSERESLLSRLTQRIGEWEKTEGTPDHTTWPTPAKDDEAAVFESLKTAWDAKTADGDTGEDKIVFAYDWVTKNYATPSADLAKAA